MATSNHYCVKFSPMQSRACGTQSPRNPQHGTCKRTCIIKFCEPRPVTLSIYRCALFGKSLHLVFPMSVRLSPVFQLFRLSNLHWDVIRPSLSVRCLSRTCIAGSSDYRRGAGHSNLKDSPVAKLEHSFQLLGVNKRDCTVEQIRKAYIDLVKIYHPDSRTPHASAEKFTEVYIYVHVCLLAAAA